MSRVRVERVHWIDAQIRANRYPNAHTVASRFEVSSRSVYDDYRFMRERLGAPIDIDRQHGGWYYTDPTYSLPFLALPEREADALRRSLLAAQIAAGLIGLYSGLPLPVVLLHNLIASLQLLAVIRIHLLTDRQTS